MGYESFDAFVEDLLAERAVRPLFIVAAAKVDSLLLDILRAYLFPQIANSKSPDELLDGDAPLSTFSARIKMSRRLGLIDETLYLALERLRHLRNLCAHSISFNASASPAREHLSELRVKIETRDSYTLTKKTYFQSATEHPIEQHQCLVVTVCVLLESIRAKIDRTTGNKSAMKIAAK